MFVSVYALSTCVVVEVLRFFSIVGAVIKFTEATITAIIAQITRSFKEIIKTSFTLLFFIFLDTSEYFRLGCLIKIPYKQIHNQNSK